MKAVTIIRQLWAHAAWADALLLDALIAGEQGGANTNTHTNTDASANADLHAIAWREYAHLLGAGAVWLARLEGKVSTITVWPTLTRDEIVALRARIVAGYDAYLARSDDASLHEPVQYTNSAGQTFRNAPYDVLLQVLLHGQYHRGKVNLLLRQGGAEPAPVDFIAFVRGAPAAVTAMAPPMAPGAR